MNHKFRIWDLHNDCEAEWEANSLHCFEERLINKDGEIVAAIGAIGKDDFFCLDDTKQLNLKNMAHEPRFRLDLWTGLRDVNGKEIFENDTIVEYPENRLTGEISDGIFELTDERGPLDKMIINEGKVKFCPPEFRLETFGTDLRGVASVTLQNGNNYEIIN